jgi:hypothetical protein
MKFILVLVLFFSTSCSNVVIDSSVGAVESNDTTATVQGCGNPPIAGYTYCRKSVGDATNDFIVFVAPVTKCNAPPCAEWKIFDADLQPIAGDFFSATTSTAKVYWSTITGKSTFDQNDLGIFPFEFKIRYLNNQDQEGSFFVQGEIRLRVLATKYISLDNTPNDSNFTFFNTYNGYQVKMTTAGRSTVVAPTTGKK